MPFDAILGQTAAVGTLERALRTGRVHHAYRFEGPDGVGKEKAAFAFAQALLCEAPPRPGEALSLGCGQCGACIRATTISKETPHVPLHPDVVLIERGLYPPEALGRKRQELTDISVDQIRRIVLERSSFPPHEGRARVFIVRRAEELSTSSANALLKTLEEPRPSTYFVLLTSRGRELIDTIRSRTQLVRFAPLGPEVMGSILARSGVAPDRIPLAVELAAGSASDALELADPEAYEKRQTFVDAIESAIDSTDLGQALALADTRDRDRDVLLDRLAALAASFSRKARQAVLNRDEGLRGADALALSRRYEIAVRAMREIEHNASPALALEAMILRLRSAAP